MNETSWRYDRAETLADGVIHVAGVILAIAGTVALLLVALRHAEPEVLIACLVYALTLVVTLSMSAIYNMWPVSPMKWSLRKYDHAAIFLLIAGTYTPFALQAEATAVLLFIWGVAAIGITMKIALPGRLHGLAIALYLAMGWSGAGLLDTMFGSFAPSVVWLLLTGGIVYSVGVIFHLWHRLRFQNAIWHGFVLGGAGIHYSAVVIAAI